MAEPIEAQNAVRLGTALDKLDERISLILARHASLAERYVTVLAARRDAEERLARLSKGRLDPRVLEDRVRELEAQNERLERHATYLESRIEGLLSRVRYGVES